MATRWSNEFHAAEHRDLKATSMSVDCTGTYALLAGEICLALKNLNKTSEALVKFPRSSKFEVGAVEWNPHPQNKELCAIACHRNVEILNINRGNCLLAHSLSTHTQTVTDLNWNHIDPCLLASCSLDRFSYVWDLRDTRRPALSLSSIVNASQIKWNRYCGNVIATAHMGDIRIWDQRKGTAPVHYLSPHDSSIYCIDWSRNKRNQLATTGQDCTVKFFNTLSLKQEHVTISSVAPVWRARYMPFGNGMLMSVIPPQKHGDNSLLMWNLSSPSSPVHSFLGHYDVVRDFAWRPCDSEKSKYQLVTWSKDGTLRLWHGEICIETVCSAVSEESINNTEESEESIIAVESNGYMADLSGGQDLEVCQAIEADEMMTTADMMLSSDSETDSSPVDVIEPPPTVPPTSPNLLSHEFSCTDLHNIPNLHLELLDPGGRVCVAAMDMNNAVIRLNIRFPLDYPNGVIPTFEFSSDTDIDHLIQAKLIKLVKHTAAQRVKKNRVCLEQCLRQFVSTVQQLLPLGDEDIGNIIKAEGNLLYRQFLNDSFIPFPRMSGANFSNSGLLVCFGRKVWNKLGHSEAVTPRNLTSLATVNSDSPFAVALFYSHQRSGYSGGFRTQRALKASVCLYDVSVLFPVRKDLAEKYVFESDNIVEMCLRNGNIASLMGRCDLEQTWGLAALAAEYPPTNGTKERVEDMPWERHPLSLDLIRSMIEYYVNFGDVQTAAMLCCTFGMKTIMPKEPEHKISNKSLSPEPEGYGLRHTIHQMDGAIEGYKLANVRLTRSSSWSDIYEETARIIEHTVVPPSINPSGRVQLEYCELYDTYKLAYADILESWQLLHARAQVMKYVSDLPSSHKGLETESKCQSCKRLSNKAVCNHCQRPILVCIVCRTPVLGLANSCYLCHHGGHTKHLQDWFSRHTICPTGCGCRCVLPLDLPS